MGTLASELAPVAAERPEPRVYADANIPNGVVQFMRDRLRWDVFFVMEHEELRRARDLEHYRLARQLARIRFVAVTLLFGVSAFMDSQSP